MKRLFTSIQQCRTPYKTQSDEKGRLIIHNGNKKSNRALRKAG